MSQSTGGPEVDKNPDVSKKKEDAEDEEKKRAEAERAKNLQVRKVSPFRRFISSIRVKFFTVIIFFALAAALAISLAASYMILYFYEDMDTLAMKERVQNAIIGLQRGGNTLTSRGMTVAMGAFMGLSTYYVMHHSVPDNFTVCEELMARAIYEDADTSNTMEGLGARSYSAPLQLIMAWDAEWNERLVYYLACDDEKGLDHCDTIDPEDVYVDCKGGDFRVSEKVKEKVPKFFRNIKDLKPKACDPPADIKAAGSFDNPCIGIAADITLEDGGPMFYILAEASMTGYMLMMMDPMVIEDPMMMIMSPNPLAGWHYLVGFNMRLLQQIQANRTGLCVSAFTAAESKVPKFIKDEIKRRQKHNLILSPHEYDAATRTILQDTDKITNELEYFASTNKNVEKTGREYCDSTYNNIGDISTSYTYVAYHGLDLSTGNLSKDDVYLLRFDYHDPLTSELFPRVEIFILCLIIVWLLCIIGMIIYFNRVFLVPLDNMRHLRAEFIQNILKGLDDDGALAQKVFGDMLDDSALIEANGDEISIMRTLQDRVDALYSRVIDNKQDDLNHLRCRAQRDLNSLKFMSFFLRRDDENLRSVLPGLWDSNEMAHRFRRGNFSNQDGGDDVTNEQLVSARQSFRSLKSILNNNIASEFFKTFCSQRGRSSLNSFFFLMDVSWLTQVEGAVRNESEDFLSSLLAESVPQSPANLSQLSSPRQQGLPYDNGMNSSSDLLCSPNPNSGNSGDVLASPRRSHFAKPTAQTQTKAGEAGSAKSSPSVPPLALSSLNDSDSLVGSPRFSSPRVQPTQFVSPNGEAIAKFIHERYFGRKSLARSDLNHAALLGCSQIPDYLAYRDKTSITFSPVMYNNLLTAVTKKFSSDVIPQFMNSSTFQIMVHCLALSGYYDKAEKANKAKTDYLLLMQEPEQKKAKETAGGVGFESPLIHSVWTVCRKAKKDAKADDDDDDDDDDSSSSSSDDDDDDDDEGDKKGKDDDSKEKKSD